MKFFSPLDATKAGRLNLPNYANVAALPSASATYTGALAWCVAEGAVYKCNGSAWTAIPTALWYLSSGIMFQTTPGKVVIGNSSEMNAAFELQVEGGIYAYKDDDTIPLVARGGYGQTKPLFQLMSDGESEVASFLGSTYSETLYIGKYYGSYPDPTDGSNILSIGNSSLTAIGSTDNKLVVYGSGCLLNFNGGSIIGAFFHSALNSLGTGTRDLATGYYALGSATAVTDSVAYGHYAGGFGAVINPQEFAGFGNYAGFGRPGNRGTYIGFKAGWSTTSRAGDGNVVLGAEAASNTTISDSIVIGNDAMSELGTTQSGVLWLHYNNGATPGIAGKFASGYFGINTTPANLGAAWDVQAYESGDKVFRYKKPGGSSMWEGLPDGSLWIGTVPDTAAAGDNQILMRDPTTGEIVKKLESAVVNAARGNNSISFIIGDGIAVITTGVALDFVWPCNATITGWQIVSTLTGSVVLDVWKDSYANFPPVVGDTIAGSEKPTLSSAVKNQDLTLSSFSTSVTAQDNWRLNVDSASTLKRITVTFFFNKTS